jgi:hypothetical protein
MTDQELKELVASLAISQKKTDEQMRRTDKKLKEMGEHIGGLGEKFGGFTEGMAFPSMEKMLRERFKMDVIASNVKSHKNGRLMELDILAYSNSDSNEIYIVEIKSRLRKKGLEQIENTLDHFFEFFPSYKGKKLYGILAVVDAPENLREEVMKKGIYLARIHDDLFELQVPETFIPRAF